MTTAEVSLASPGALRPLLAITLHALAVGERKRCGPIPPVGPGVVVQRIEDALGGAVLPDVGVGPVAALRTLVEALAWGSADPRDVRCAAHLHCPPLAVAVAADLAVSALNPSLDSWDQAPSGVAFEEQVIRAMVSLAGLPPAAGGCATSGATESNLMGVLLARAHLGPEIAVLHSEAAHFSVRHAARVAGLPDAAVITVPVDSIDRMDAEALDAVLGRLGGRPAVVVATAGTTDLAAIDPLLRIAAIAARHGSWLHVDAAYGGGALFSDHLRHLLEGLDAADSIALDLHKLGWQPVPAGFFLARDAGLLDPLHRRAPYLNAPDDEAAGMRGRLGQSLRTTRRPDAFPVAVTMRALGRRGLGALVDRCHDTALYAAARLSQDDRFQIAAPPILSTVVFRYIGGRGRGTLDGPEADAVNAALRRRLLVDGAAVTGRTEWHGRTWLKLTLLNPDASRSAIDGLLALVAAAGDAETSPSAVA